MSDVAAQIADNVARVRERIASAAQRSGRTSDGIKLVSVTKYVTIEIVGALLQAGCRDFGESRPQELWQKAEALAEHPIHWHMIGHLQRNKVSRTVAVTTLFHSLDSRRLAEAIDENARNQGRICRVLLEVNISGESAKHGFAPDAVEPALAEIAALPHLRVQGLMGMASGDGALTSARRQFCELRKLRDRLVRVAPPNISLDELSMGMSHDYEVAIEEGATIVRIGSALFEGLA